MIFRFARHRPLLFAAIALAALTVLAAGTVTAPPRGLAAPAERGGRGAPTGSHLFVSVFGAGHVAQFDLAPAGDAIVPGQTAPAAFGPFLLAANPAGTRLYVTGSTSAGAIHVFTLDATGSIVGAPVAVALPPGSQNLQGGVVVHPAGSRVYVADFAANRVVAVPADANGDLIGPGTVTTPPGGALGPVGMVVNAGGTRLYVANTGPGNGGTTVSVFPLNAAGDIAGPGTNATLPGGAQGPSLLALNPANTRLYVTDFGGSALGTTVTVFPLDAAGDIAGAGTNATLPGGATGPIGLAVNAAASRLYVANAGSDLAPGTTVSVFPLNAAGDIAGPGTNQALPAGSTGAYTVALNAANTRLYVAAFYSGELVTFPLAPNGDTAGPGTAIPMQGRAPFPTGLLVLESAAPTPTATATSTPTATVTPTSSSTATATATVTAPAALTATATGTAGPALTATATATGVAATATVTRTPSPVAPTPTPVIPEAPPLWLFGSGLLAMGWFGVRRRR